MARLLGHIDSAWVVIFLVSVMLSVRLEATFAGLVSVTHKKKLLAKTFVANFAGMPLLATPSALMLPPNLLFTLYHARRMKTASPFRADG